MPWEIPKKISLLAVAILFLFTFFTLILDAPRKKKNKYLNKKNEYLNKKNEYLYKKNEW